MSSRSKKQEPNRQESIKIIDSFCLKQRGILTILQHQLNGIPPNTQLINGQTDESWIVKKRVLSGALMNHEEEIYFDCDNSF